MFSVYILHSEKYNKIYIGFTSNLSQRLLSHNELGKKGWTIKYRPWTLIHEQKFETKEEALAKEKAIEIRQG